MLVIICFCNNKLNVLFLYVEEVKLHHLIVSGNFVWMLGLVQ